MAEMEKLCRGHFERFGTAGHANHIRVIDLEDMAARYAKGSLDAITARAA